MLELNPLLAFTAGLVSIISPCVLPLIPAMVSATQQGTNKLRPLALVAGLALTFTTLGIIAAAFGSLFVKYQPVIYGASITIIVLMGYLMLFDLHLPIHTGLLSKLAYATFRLDTEGLASGFALGAALGVVWLPCTGPVLGVILTMVATQGSLLSGALMLLIYSCGFSVPLLAIAYSARFTRLIAGKTDRMIWIRRLSGAVLLIAGVYMTLPFVGYI